MRCNKQCVLLGVCSDISVLCLQEYQALADLGTSHPDVWIGLACSRFFLGMYKESADATSNGMV